MNGKEILVDTNIIFYLLRRDETLRNLLQGKTVLISFMTELELIGFSDQPDEEKQITNLLNDCFILSLNEKIKKQFRTIRKLYKLKLADAIIAATALAYNLPILTADKQFKTIEGLRLVIFDV